MRTSSLSALVLLTAVMVSTSLGCTRLLAKKTKPACDLVTDAEIEAATGGKVDHHEGAQDSCTWTMNGQSGAQSVYVAVMSPLAAKVIPTMGNPEAIAGLGDEAEWTGGLAPQLRVKTKGKVLHVMIVGVPGKITVTEGEKKVVSHEKTKNGETTLETQEMNIDYPDLKKAAVSIAGSALKRM